MWSNGGGGDDLKFYLQRGFSRLGLTNNTITVYSFVGPGTAIILQELIPLIIPKFLPLF